MILILAIILLITGLIPFYNWFILEMNIYYDISLPEIANSMFIHRLFGAVFIILILFYMSYHLVSDRNIVSSNPKGDVKSFINSISFTFLLSNRRQIGEGGIYHRSQKILFLLFIYSIGLIIISGLLLYLEEFLTEEAFKYSMDNGFLITHILAVIIIIILVIILIANIVRKWDGVALKCMLITGKVPLWYVKKNHKLWYEELMRQDK